MVRNGVIIQMYRKEKLLENRDFIIIGENIRRLRRSKNYTQEYLAGGGDGI